jgi:quinol monooxygenase YgiN
VIPAEIDRIIEIITAEIPLFQSSESGILSFVAMQSLEEFETIILWERYVSRAAFDQLSQKDGIYFGLMEKIKEKVQVEDMTEYVVAGGYLSNA